MEKENAVAADVLRVALRLHCRVGPGLLESVYKNLLARDLRALGHYVETEVVIPVVVDGVYFEQGFRADLIVDNCLIVEVKGVPALLPVFAKQLLTYLRFKNMRLGLLLNFDGARLFDGVKRVANGMPDTR